MAFFRWNVSLLCRTIVGAEAQTCKLFTVSWSPLLTCCPNSLSRGKKSSHKGTSFFIITPFLHLTPVLVLSVTPAIYSTVVSGLLMEDLNPISERQFLCLFSRRWGCWVHCVKEWKIALRSLTSQTSCIALQLDWTWAQRRGCASGWAG